MSALRCRSFAKINLHLEVVGRRADGYHELRTLFQSVALHDVVEVESAADGCAVEVMEGEAPEDASNLAARAAALLLERFAPRRDGARIRLWKRIPLGAGLGGGSSNAATTLWALNRLFGGPATAAELSELAAELGADVPYFLSGGTAWGTGRGDRIEPLPDLEEQEIWLVTPPVEVSTAEVFARLGLPAGVLTPRDTPSSIVRLVEVGTEARADRLQAYNDLEAGVLGHYPEIREAREVLVDAGGASVRLSGSGATLYAFFHVPVDVGALRRRLPAGSRIVCSRTLSRPSYLASRIVDPSGGRSRDPVAGRRGKPLRVPPDAT